MEHPQESRPGAPHDETFPALVIGAGPAGLMAAERIGAAGHAVLIAEQRPSPARKLLMAGKSGLNLTREEDPARFAGRYTPPDALAGALARFGAAEVMDWAQGLGIALFTGSTGRVFPVGMKASPLLRAWLGRLSGQGAELRTRWIWRGWDGAAALFDTPDGVRRIHAGVTVLALGGASWARLGSDGAWAPVLADAGQKVAPFLAANSGLALDWSPLMARWFGQPVKNVGLVVDGRTHRGEFVLSARGLEGGGLYPLTPQLRTGAPLALDLAPDLAPGILEQRLDGAGRQSLGNRLRRAGLAPVAVALAQEFGRPLLQESAALAQALKALPVPVRGLRPMDEAISTAGGLAFAGLDAGFQLAARPGCFAAGEMLDWEAPTGGYLLTGCLATGFHAGEAALRRLSQH